MLGRVRALSAHLLSLSRIGFGVLAFRELARMDVAVGSWLVLPLVILAAAADSVDGRLARRLAHTMCGASALMESLLRDGGIMIDTDGLDLKARAAREGIGMLSTASSPRARSCLTAPFYP